MGGQTENRPSLISIFQNSFRLKADHHTDVIIDGSCAFEELTATAGETTYRVKKNGEDTGYTVTFRQDETDSSKYHVVIDGLDEMNLNSTAITYYLEKQPDDDTISVGTTTYRKDDTAPAGQKRYRIEEDGIDTGKVVTFTETESGYDVSITQNGVTTPVYGAEKTQLMDVLINRNIPIADSTDTYRMQFKNDGINATVTNRIFQGGSASLVLTGAEEYETTIQWIDSQPTSDFRRDAVNSFNAGSFAIWRYVDKPGDNNKYEKVAFFGTAIIVPDENNDPDKAAISYVELVETDDGNGGTVTQARPVSIPKYDLDGNPYVYYVKGAPVIGNLQYETNLLINGFTDPNAQANIPDAIANGSTLTSKLTGDILFPITAGWVAAARQSGTASIAFEVQKNMGTAEEPDWQRVDIPSTDDQGNPITNATLNYATVDASMTNQGTQGSATFDSNMGYYLVPTDAGQFAQLIEVVADGYEPMLTTMYLWNYDPNSLWNQGKPRRHTIVLHQNENQLKSLTLDTPNRDGKFKDSDNMNASISADNLLMREGETFNYSQTAEQPEVTKHIYDGQFGPDGWHGKKYAHISGMLAYQGIGTTAFAHHHAAHHRRLPLLTELLPVRLRPDRQDRGRRQVHAEERHADAGQPAHTAQLRPRPGCQGRGQQSIPEFR